MIPHRVALATILAVAVLTGGCTAQNSGGSGSVADQPPAPGTAQEPVTAAPPAASVEPTHVRVTDTTGNVTTLALDAGGGTMIDYTSYSFMYTRDFEYGGLRLKQGEGTVSVRWEKIDRVVVKKLSSSDAEAEITMHSGGTQTVGLVPWSKEGLAGETELGEFKIDLEKVRTIDVIR